MSRVQSAPNTATNTTNCFSAVSCPKATVSWLTFFLFFALFFWLRMRSIATLAAVLVLAAAALAMPPHRIHLHNDSNGGSAVQAAYPLVNITLYMESLVKSEMTRPCDQRLCTHVNKPISLSLSLSLSLFLSLSLSIHHASLTVPGLRSGKRVWGLKNRALFERSQNNPF